MRLVRALLRFAADRWVIAGRPDPYREWLAEADAVRAESPFRTLAALRFAASLATRRAPGAEGAVGLGGAAVLGRVALLLVAPFVGCVWFVAAYTVVDMFQYGGTGTALVLRNGVRLLVVGGIVVALALAGRRLGRRLPLSASMLPGHRLRVTAVCGSILLAVGFVLAELALVMEMGRSMSPGDTVLWTGSLGIGLSAATLAILVPPVVVVVRGRIRAGARRMARVWTVLGAAVVADAAVTVGALPRMLSVPGSLPLLPLWFPVLALDPAGTIPFGPSYRQLSFSDWLSTYAGGITTVVLPTVAFGLAYLVASARPRPQQVRPTQPVVEHRYPRWAGWVLSVVGGLGWIAAASMLPSVARQMSGNVDTDLAGAMLYGQLDVRTAAIVLCCCGVAMILRGTAPAWPLLPAGVAMYVIDVVVSRGWYGPVVSATVVSLALLVPVAAVLVARLAARHDRPYGRMVMPTIALLTAALAPASLLQAEQFTGTGIDEPFTSAFAASSALLGAACAYGVYRHRLEQGRPLSRRARDMFVAVPVILAVLVLLIAHVESLVFTVFETTSPALAIAVAATLRRPGARRGRLRVVGLSVLAVVSAPGLMVLCVMLGYLAAAIYRPVLLDPDGAPEAVGDILIGAALAGWRWISYQPPNAATPAEVPPAPSGGGDPVPAVAQAR